MPEKTVGVAFSGGVDSSLLAVLCGRAGKDVTLLTVGFEGSHDLGFSTQISRTLKISHKTATLSDQEFQQDIAAVKALISCRNTSHVENCIAFRSIVRLARQNKLDIVLSANGLDELFCGYNGYRLVYGRGEGAIMELMQEKIANELELVREITRTTKEYEVSVRQPFLSDSFIQYSKKIPLADKITGEDDMMRKHAIRRAALELGVAAESALKRKKALQYGSLIDKRYKTELKKAWR
jgi:asparagine synthase (glutamine-hydrolysing)